MSEEIIENNEALNNEEAQNPVTENENTEQQQTPNEEKGANQKEEEPQKVTYKKIGREVKQKVTFYKDEARNALAREVAETARNKEAKIAAKKALCDKFNADLQKLEAEIKALDEDAKVKAEIACTGELREQILCDAYQTENEVIYVPEGENPEAKSTTIIARLQRIPEETQFNEEEK